jgi:hypothetical protein
VATLVASPPELHVVVHRDGAGGAYRHVDVIAPPAELSAQALDLGRLPTGDLFAATFGED